MNGAAILLFAFAALATPQKAAQNRLRELKAELEKKLGALRHLDDNTRSLLLTIEDLDRGLVALRQRSEEASRQASAAQQRLRETQRQLASEEDKLRALQRRLRQRMRALYISGRGQSAKVLLDAKSFADLSLRRYAQRKMAKNDALLVRQHQRQKAKVQDKERELQKISRRMTALFDEVAEEKELAAIVRDERQAAIARIDEEKELGVRAVREIVAEQRALTRFVGDLLRKTPPRKKHGRGVLKDGLRWPVHGTLVRGFGTTRESGTRVKLVSKGVHLRAPAGTVVVAAADGVVVHRGWMRGYGQLVIVNHGDGQHTLYAHLARIDVDQGERVLGGEVLGTVGDTGSTDGDKLYFELRIGGEARDPLPYLRSMPDRH